MSVVEIATPEGPARAHVHDAADARALLLLGHAAGGGVNTPDLLAARESALAAGVAVGLVEQPYRVAGRRGPAAAAKLDAAWLAVAGALTTDLPLITGGRSSGARVACRTAEASGAVAVLCLAFPLHPPWRPEQTRLPELDAVRVPALVVQGERDRFGIPPPGQNREVVTVPGDHSLKSAAAVKAAVAEWLPRVLA